MLKNYLNSPIIIIGMHRSGTTFLSKVLDDAGIFQGVFKDHNNEAFHFLSINQEVLKKAGFDWLNPGVPTSEFWTEHSAEVLISQHFKINSIHPVKQRLFYNYPWGWKDPRNTFTLPMWLSMFPEARVINMVRNGKDVALSLANRNKENGEVHDDCLNNLDFNFKLWEKYIEQAEQFQVKTKNWLNVSYEALMALDKTVILNLSNFTGKDLNEYLKTQRKEGAPKVYPKELIELANNSHAYKIRYSH